MSKEKILASAEKYIKSGKIDKAIKEFERVLDLDMTDMRTKLKIGDLLMKKRDLKVATKVYQRQDHRDGVKVRSMKLAAKQPHDAGDERRRHAQADQQVHVRRSMNQGSQSACQNRRAGGGTQQRRA